MPSAADINVSKNLQRIASGIDRALEIAAGEKVRFSLFVWSDGRPQYVANAERADVVLALKAILAKWEEGMPDVPTHEVQ